MCIYIFFRIFNYQLIGYGSVYICSVYFVLYFVRFQYSFCISRLFILYIHYQFVGFGSAVHVEASMISLAISLGRVYLRYSTYTETETRTETETEVTTEIGAGTDICFCVFMFLCFCVLCFILFSSFFALLYILFLFIVCSFFICLFLSYSILSYFIHVFPSDPAYDYWTLDF